MKDLNEDVTQVSNVDAGKISTFNDKDDINEIYQKLQEVNDNEKSPFRQKFEDYCKDKIEDLGTVTLYFDEDDDDPYSSLYNVILHSPQIREYTDVRVVIDIDYSEELFRVIDKDNKMVIETLMIDPLYYTLRCEFDKIDKDWYNLILDNWEQFEIDYNFSEDKTE